ncbi:MAG: AAA family ATPase, partial [Anaerolineales bacterium]|nr:AAA family ATPase [Anaerolineales bacterium]
MPQFSISLFGLPRFALDGKQLDHVTPRATALLAYLAVTQQPQARELLINLLWTDKPTEKAYGVLRTTLWRLNKDPLLACWLDIQQDKVSLTALHEIQVDVNLFRLLIESCSQHGHLPNQICQECVSPLQKAIHLYQGIFMQGFHYKKARLFADWQTEQADSLHQDALAACLLLADYHTHHGDLNHGIIYAKQALALLPTSEELHRKLMNLYIDSGQRSAALDQYKACKQILKQEGMPEPSPETNLLYDQIKEMNRQGRYATDPLQQPVYLLIDFENALALWSTFPAQAERILDRFRTIIKRCLGRHSAKIVHLEGNMVTVFFQRGQPLHCAVEIHRRIAQETWQPFERPQVRMALNTTEAESTFGDPQYSGVNRTAQLLYASSSGQVLLTEQALRVLEIPQGARIHDHGLYLLNNIDEPINIYEMQHPDLPAPESPSLKTISKYTHNLPTPPTHFVGRQREMADIQALLEQPDCRLVTLIGPGGVGKTRLALQLAATNLSRYPDGVYFLTFATIRHTDNIPTELAEILHFQFFGSHDPLIQIINYLRPKRLLLIMDNLEHLTEGSATLSDLLAQAPGLTILATSRERLKLNSEWVYELQGLPYPLSGDPPEQFDQSPAVQLFLHSARRSSPRFQLHEPDKDCILRICQLVNGLPLGLELAASGLRNYSCCEIARQVEQDLDGLQSTLRDLPPRQRSLRAVFDHSWGLLTEEERRVLRLCSIFRGGFTAPMAQQVAGASISVLASLADKSMLQITSNARYQILEVIRHFARQKLNETPGECEAALTRHCDAFADFLFQKMIQFFTHDQIQAMQESVSEFENVRIAWEWAIAHCRWDAIDKSQPAIYRFHEIRSRFKDGWDIFANAVERLHYQVSESSAPVLARLQMWKAWFSFRLGEHEQGLQGMQDALQVFRRAGLQWDTAYTYAYLADAKRILGEWDDAQAYLDQSSKAYPFGEQPVEFLEMVQASQVNLTQGLIYSSRGQYALARSFIYKARHIFSEIGNLWDTARANTILATIANHLEEYEQSLKLQRQAMDTMQL